MFINNFLSRFALHDVAALLAGGKSNKRLRFRGKSCRRGQPRQVMERTWINCKPRRDMQRLINKHSRSFLKFYTCKRARSCRRRHQNQQVDFSEAMLMHVIKCVWEYQEQKPPWRHPKPHAVNKSSWMRKKMRRRKAGRWQWERIQCSTLTELDSSQLSFVNEVLTLWRILFLI